MSNEFYAPGSNELLDTYLKYVEETESPRVFHVWSLTACVAAALGRRAYMPFGARKALYPNLYIALVGPPAVRKSTAVNVARSLLEQATAVRFAPDDTAGQRQGLISAMQIEELQADEVDGVNESTFASLDALNGMKMKIPDLRDRNTIMVVASEFASFIGQNSMDMITFLTKTYDGESYQYRLRRDSMVLREPLITMLAGTTPTSISQSLPQAVMGQGFMSRVIFVSGTMKYKQLPFPPPLDEELAEQIRERLSEIGNLEGEFVLTERAKAAIEKLYMTERNLHDTRFVYYLERRHDHLLKTCMCVAAMDLSMSVDTRHVIVAEKLLSYTEAMMPDALGEYGLSQVAAAKQKLLEYLQAANTPVPMGALWALMSRDMKRVDFVNSLHDMVNSGRLMQMHHAEWGEVYVYKDKKKDKDRKLEKYLDNLDEFLTEG